MTILARRCDSCEEQISRYRLILTRMDGEVLDIVHLCEDCLRTAKIQDVLSIGPTARIVKDE
jgi:hypothetical protein